MSKIKIMLRLLLALTALHASSPYAEEESTAERNVTLRGFGTLGAVYHSAPGVKYRRDISQSTDGAGASQVSFAQDSMLAIQADAHTGSHFKSSLQVITRQNVYGNFAPEVSMAYLKYQAGDSFLRLGRTNIEIYMQGDSAEIGYAHLPVRQPVIYYPRTIDGVDAEKTQPLGGGMIRLKGLAGWATGKLVGVPPVYDAAGSRCVGAIAEYSYGGWIGRFSFGEMTLKNEIDSLLPGGSLTTAITSMPNGAQFFNKFSMQDRTVRNKMLGVTYDAGSVQGSAGYAQLSSHDWEDESLFYAYAGYRIEQFTPYVSYSSGSSARNFVSTGIPDGLSTQTDMLNQAMATAQSNFLLNQSDVALGSRYDFAHYIALKLQADYIRYQDSYSIVDSSFSTSSAESRGYKTLLLYSVALDFVF
jgi:hypothetical protein